MLFLKISQYSHENTRARVSFLMMPATLLKTTPWCFHVNFAKFLRILFS